MCFHKAANLDPKNVTALSNLGFIHHKLGNFQEAIEWDQKAIAINQNHKFTHENLALSLDSFDRKEEAAAEFEKVTILDPHNPEGHNNLGFALYKLDRLHEAQRSFSRAIELDLYKKMYYNNFIRCLSSTEKKEEGLEFLRRLMGEHPDCKEASDAHSNLKLILEKNRNK